MPCCRAANRLLPGSTEGHACNVGDRPPSVLPKTDWSTKLVNMREVGASDFKARCLALIDEVNATGSPGVITKRGQPVAELVRYSGGDDRFPQEALRNSVSFDGDVEQPVVAPGDWKAVGE